MTTRFLDSAHQILKEAKEHVLARTGRSEAAVLYSGGKDARTVLDLAVKTFDRVLPVAMYFLPDLRCFEEQIGDARTRYGLEVLQLPHWENTRKLLADPPLFRFPMTPEERAAVPEWGVRDVYDIIVRDTGIPLILDGAKKADGLWRRRTLVACSYHEVFHPIQDWHKAHVLDYLNANGIPLPTSWHAVSGGVGLNEPAIFAMSKDYPDDWAKVLKVFPLAQAVVERRKFFGA